MIAFLLIAACSTARAGVPLDCNGNSIPDDVDIANCPPGNPACADCNANGVPDECDLAARLPEQVAKVTAADAAAGDSYGAAVSVSGTTAAVGAYLDDDDGADSGAVYLSRSIGGIWQQTDKLTADDAAPNSWFGFSVSLSGDTLLIGAQRDSQGGQFSGAAYVFANVAGQWQQIAKLIAADSADFDTFGYSVSLSGSTAVIGSPFDADAGPSSGSAYVFREVAGSWQQIAKLSAADGAAGDLFGFSVSIDGDTILVGAMDDDDNGMESGSVYVFREIAGSWSQIAKLTTSDGDIFHEFGRSVSLEGDTALIGAWGDRPFGVGSGSAYIFREIAGAWQQLAKLSAADGAAGDLFGFSVSLSGDSALVGAVNEDHAGLDSGSAYLFRETAGTWQQLAKLTADDAAAGDQHGWSVSLAADTALIGAPQDDDGGDASGSAFVFQPLVGLDCNDNAIPDECELDGNDCNANGIPDDCDIASGDSADCNANAVPDECELDGNDCNANGIPDDCDIASAVSQDCNANTIPDECDIDSGASDDCNANAVPDECDIAAETSADCNANTIPDECDIDSGASDDCNANAVPDECDIDAGTGAEQTDRATGSAAAAGHLFGISLSAHADLLLAGAIYDDHAGLQSGAAYVFQDLAGTLQQIARLTAADAGPGDNFGHAVALAADTALVSARLDSDIAQFAGSVYVSRDLAGTWQQLTKINNPDPVAIDLFGHALALDGDTALIAAIGDDDGAAEAGSVYVYREIAGTWQQVAKLTADDATAGDVFGISVALSGDTALIGTRDDHAGMWSGSAYVFREIAGTWQQVAKLTADDAAADDQFGFSVALSGASALIGAPFDDNGGPAPGSVYVFRDVAGTWQQVDKLTVSDATAGAFGHSVSAGGAGAVIGAPQDAATAFRSGAAYLFRESAGVWQQVTRMTADDAAELDEFGYTVAQSGNTSFVASIGHDGAGLDSGAVYVFQPRDADCNDNGVFDECELGGSDCNLNGIPDDCDIAAATSEDCNLNGLPDECDSALAADFDDDCDVDLNDFSTFSVCFAGPGVMTPPLGCAPDEFTATDLDADGDVDLGDFATFATAFGG